MFTLIFKQVKVNFQLYNQIGTVSTPSQLSAPLTLPSPLLPPS